MQISLLTKIARLLTLLALLAFTVTPALAWSGPQVGPPGCTSGQPGCDAPVNISATAQTKGGPLNISLPSGYANWGINVSGGTLGIIGQSSSNVAIQGISNTNVGVYGASNSTWAGEFINGGGSELGLYAQNGLGYYAELANSSYGLYTNGNMYNGATYYTNGDEYMPWYGGYLSSYLSSLSSRTSIAFGGMWEEYSNGVGMVGNPWTGGLSCPSWAPTAREAAVGASGNGVYPFYLYYCTG
jgi:hypothetical protein